jgi:hypothetical protein
MYLVNEYLLASSEQYLDLIDRVKNLNQKVWDVAEPRYQFNLKLFNNEIKTFMGKDLFFYEALDCSNFCFRPVFYIKRELYDLLKQMVNDEITIGYSSLNFIYHKTDTPVFYNSNTIYDKVEIGAKIEHCKVMATFDNIKVEIPPIGSSINGIPFFEDKLVDESQTSGWWIEGTSIKYFINTFNLGSPKNIQIDIFYYKDS